MGAESLDGKKYSILVHFPEKERVPICEPSRYLCISGQKHPYTAVNLKEEQQTSI